MALGVGVTLLVLVSRDRAPQDRARRPRPTSPQLGGLGVAWRLRARRTPLVLGSFATPRWHRTPLRLGASAPGSVLLVGPTQSGKTTSVCAPMLLAWDGPVLAASVKGDLVARTSSGRAARGRVQVVAPDRADGSVFDPVALARTPEDARGLARDLTVATGAGQSAGDQEFWSSLSAKLLAPLLLAANRAGGSIATVQSWVDRRELDEPLAYLEHDGADALVASFSRDDRTLGSVLATVEAAIEPLSEGGDAIDPARLLEAANTCYLAAPLHDQRRYRPMFSGVVRQVLAEAARRAERGTPSGLLVLLDEAASIAPLEELDQVAATCQGQGVTLVTVWQDLAQLVARFGPKARTVVNNHTTRVLLGGLADPSPSRSGSRPSRAPLGSPPVTRRPRWRQRSCASGRAGRRSSSRDASHPCGSGSARAPWDPAAAARYASAHGALRSGGSALGHRPDAALRRAPRGGARPPDARRLLGLLAPRGLPRHPPRPSSVVGLAQHRPRARAEGARRRGAGTAAIRAGARTPPVLFRDPPDHSRLRGLVQRAFTPHTVAELTGFVEAETDALLDAALEAGTFDVVESLAWPLPVAVISELLGVPREDRDEFKDRSAALARGLDPEFLLPEELVAARDEALAQFAIYFHGLFEERRRHPTDDLLSALVAAHDGEDRLSDVELLSTAILLLVAQGTRRR